MVNNGSEKKKGSKILGAFAMLLVIPFLVPVIPLIALLFILYAIKTLILRIAVLLFWSTRKIQLLYVYSNSPNWKIYIEQNILPRLPDQKILLNWSERQLWQRFSLASLVFNHYKKQRDYNPMAIAIKPFSKARVFRFYSAFCDLKHNKPETLQKIEKEFFDYVKS